MGDRDAGSLERTRVPQKRGESDSFIDITVQRVHDSNKHPIGFLCIARDITENVRLHQSLESLSITDELTTLFNQRHLFATLPGEIERTRRFQKRLSVIF